MGIQIDSSACVPIYKQIYNQIIDGIATGAFHDDQRLPTERDLSVQLHVSRGTVRRAYKELRFLGWVTQTQGAGTFITCGKSEHNRALLQNQIGSMISRLSRMGLSREEIKFQTLDYLVCHLETDERIRFAWIDRYLIFPQSISSQLSVYNLEIDSFYLDDALEHMDYIDRNYDLIATVPSLWTDVASRSAKEVLRVPVLIDRAILQRLIHSDHAAPIAIVYSDEISLNAMKNHLQNSGPFENIVTYHQCYEYALLLKNIDHYRYIAVSDAENYARLKKANTNAEILLFANYLDYNSISLILYKARSVWLEKMHEMSASDEISFQTNSHEGMGL